jgi:hypothetical protein
VAPERAASFSYADSRSSGVPYVAQSGEMWAASVTAGSPMAAIRERGARSRVHATGVGAPRSESTVTIASPVPSDVSSSSMS